MNNVRPQLTLMNEEQIRQTHRYTLRILGETGVRVDSPSALKLLEKKLGLKAEGRVIKFPLPVVEDAFQSAPKTVDVFNRRGDPAFRLGDDRQLDDPNAALSEILKVGPGGSFLTQPSTMKNYKNGYYVSRVYPRQTMEKWQEAGRPTAHQVLREKTRALLASAPAPHDHDDLMGKGEEFIRAL